MTAARPIQWVDAGRRSADGRWRVTRERLRGMSVWSLRDTTIERTLGYDSPDIVSTHRSLKEAHTAAERITP